MTTPDLTPDRLAEGRALVEVVNLTYTARLAAEEWLRFNAPALLSAAEDRDRLTLECAAVRAECSEAYEENDRLRAEVAALRQQFARGSGVALMREERDRLREEVEALRQQFARGGDVGLMRAERDAAVAEVARLESIVTDVAKTLGLDCEGCGGFAAVRAESAVRQIRDLTAEVARYREALTGSVETMTAYLGDDASPLQQAATMAVMAAILKRAQG